MITESVEQTGEVAAEFATQLLPGDVVLMTGEVGSGKSTFVRAALRSLGVSGAIPSPTFTLARSYEARSGPVSHLDLYRIGPLDGEVPDLLGEYLTPETIAFVEWPGEPEPERELLRRASRVGRVRMSYVDKEVRRIEVEPPAGV